MNNWQVDNYKEFSIYKFIYMLMALPVVIFALLRLADSEYSTDPNLFLIVLPILILINLLFFPNERVSIESQNGEYFILKHPRFGNKNLLQLNLKKGALKSFELTKSNLSIGGKLVINYAEGNESKKVEIALKNFSTKNRQTLLEYTKSEI